MKKTICLLLCVLIFVAMPVSALAAQAPEPALPQSLYTAEPTLLFFADSDGDATIKLRCEGKNTVTKISAKTCIEKKSGTKWVKVDVGTSDNYLRYTVNSSMLSKSYTKTLPSKGTYRCTATFTLYADKNETITVSKTATY